VHGRQPIGIARALRWRRDNEGASLRPASQIVKNLTTPETFSRLSNLTTIEKKSRQSIATQKQRVGSAGHLSLMLMHFTSERFRPELFRCS
jgi:hypothetical protein